MIGIGIGIAKTMFSSNVISWLWGSSNTWLFNETNSWTWGS